MVTQRVAISWQLLVFVAITESCVAVTGVPPAIAMYTP